MRQPVTMSRDRGMTNRTFEAPSEPNRACLAHPANISRMRQSGDMASQRPPQEPGAAARSRAASVEFVEMMDRAVAVADAEAVGGRDRRADPGLGVAHGALEILAPGEPGGDRRGQRAAGAMGVASGNARRGQRDRGAGIDEIVDALGALAVPALDQDRPAAERQQAAPLALDLGLAGRDRFA